MLNKLSITNGQWACSKVFIEKKSDRERRKIFAILTRLVGFKTNENK